MASLSPSIFSLPQNKLPFLSLNQQPWKLPCYANQNHQPRTRPLISASSTKKSRAKKKVKSDEELCNDLLEFVASVGLPDGHVPTMNELSRHGRKDLANIVRRRGYKLIRELLTNAIKSSSARSEMEEVSTEKRPEPTNCHDETVNPLTEDTPLSSEDSVVEIYRGGSNSSSSLSSADEIDVSEDSSTISLPEQVAKFIENGELDSFEGWLYDSHSISTESNAEEGEEVAHTKTETESGTIGEEHSEDELGGSETATLFNGSTLITKKITTATINKPQSQKENQVEVDHLKLMLLQKELELTKLKEQIEKEKLALAVLQTKAETEINSAQKLILEKDAELLAAEESLSGLEEVEIQYSGEGETVEVAGSFNGWHHPIKMELQPLSSVSGHVGTRRSRLWSIVLWLYPGVYEIKFIVDGHWRIDPQKETVTKGSILNNILRVDR
ncbi:AMP-activated protein kinase, glycogen-binding domain [Dillenia turbinata]|uniref:AMP-activated protein kinase, glycogen-binding domain n=1 Tax=Dillenia turbinata TaxID=194707 RepID=A0AAN8ZIR3_9MAGN